MEVTYADNEWDISLSGNKSAADVFNSSLTVRERLVKPYLCARLKKRVDFATMTSR